MLPNHTINKLLTELDAVTSNSQNYKMKNIIYLLSLCLIIFSCTDDELSKEEVSATCNSNGTIFYNSFEEFNLDLENISTMNLEGLNQ